MKNAAHDNRVDDILELARKSGTEIRLRDRAALDRAADGAAHQGCIGYCDGYAYASLDDVFACAEQRNEPPFIVVLDGIEDPHNLGSIIRSCECGGVHGMILGKNRQVPVNDTVIKVAEGAAEHMRIVRTVNINDAVRTLKTRGVWVYALDAAGKDIKKENLGGAIALVIGAEGKGVSRLTEKLCDGVLSLPMRGKINSLNASVAAALGIYCKIFYDTDKANKQA